MCACRPRWLAALLAGLWLATSVADERILSFSSEIRVQRDASLLVTERIAVQVEGRQIRRGIYRDFPTDYRDRLGNRVRVDFRLLQVLRNDQPEPHRVESRANGVRIWLGDATHMLTPGAHHYTLRYYTNRQLGHFPTHDEVYWNVTGNGWAFVIDRATARVRLPDAVPWQELRLDLYTGPGGAQGQAASSRVVDGAVVEFETTAPLPPGHGLTVAVGWPRGLVTRPSRQQRVAWFFTDNGAAIAMLLGFAAALAWYLWSWLRVGRDPRAGTIMPRFEPPVGLSPAACRYVLDMGFGRDAFVAALVSLGVKGHLRIDEQDDVITLYRTRSQTAGRPTAGEAAVLEQLLPEEDAFISLEQEHHREFQAARNALSQALAREYKGRMFNLNSIHAVPAMAASLLGGIAAVPLGASALLWVLYPGLSVLLHVIFLFLLRAPTPAGRQLMDEIEGLRMYLGTAERDRLERMRSPRLTPEVFETFLPYAFALGVQNSWCERLARELPELQSSSSGGWQPSWYSGHRSGAQAMKHLGSGFAGSMSSAIAAASAPPGSTSGGGGGGSSGGGGGGGGGGGW